MHRVDSGLQRRPQSRLPRPSQNQNRSRYWSQCWHRNHCGSRTNRSFSRNLHPGGPSPSRDQCWSRNRSSTQPEPEPEPEPQPEPEPEPSQSQSPTGTRARAGTRTRARAGTGTRTRARPEPEPEPEPEPPVSVVAEVMPLPEAVSANEAIPTTEEPSVVSPVEPVPVWAPPSVSEVPAQAELTAPEPPATEVFWESVLREQQDLPTIVAAGAVLGQLDPPKPAAPDPATPGTPFAAIDRPPVVVHQPQQAYGDEGTPATAPQPARAPRPRAVVRAATPERGAATSAGRLAPLATQASDPQSKERSLAPELTMAAPVEMWFGDHRVGVKHGTKTYDQFRRYADSLFDDLRGAESAR